MHALIDGDLILYRACHAVQSRMYVAYREGEPFACSPRKANLSDYDELKYIVSVDEDSLLHGIKIVETMIKTILKEVFASGHTVYLTGGGNFREEIYDEYKAQRPDKPIIYKALKSYMLKTMGATLVEGQEADDAMGIAQCDNTIICSYDKDMLMIPGSHYQFNKKVFIEITEEEGMLNFYKQLLTGDTVDNIPGLKGIGPKKAEKILEPYRDEDEVSKANAVLEEYKEHYPDLTTVEAIELIERNGQLLWIRKEEDEVWRLRL